MDSTIRETCGWRFRRSREIRAERTWGTRLACPRSHRRVRHGLPPTMFRPQSFSSLPRRAAESLGVMRWIGLRGIGLHLASHRRAHRYYAMEHGVQFSPTRLAYG